MSSDWCYPLCALATLVLRLIGFDNPCRFGTEMVALVRVIRLVHILLPVHYPPRVAFLSTCLLHPWPGWYDIVAELRLIRARTGATPCVR